MQGLADLQGDVNKGPCGQVMALNVVKHINIALPTVEEDAVHKDMGGINYYRRCF